MLRIRIIMGDISCVLDLKGDFWSWYKVAMLIRLGYLVISCGAVAGLLRIIYARSA